MKILAIDTSTMMSSIAISDDEKIIGDFNINQKETHSEMLVPLIERLLKDLHLNLEDIDLFAVAEGPGSFTGLRIGMTSLKAMAQSLNKPIVGISTLEGLAFSILNHENIISLLDARGSRYYAGFYKQKDNNIEKKYETLIEEEQLIEEMKKLDKVVLVGEGVYKISANIKNMKNVILAHSGLNYGIAKNLCILAKQRFENGQLDDVHSIEPAYLRKSQAEINLDKKSN